MKIVAVLLIAFVVLLASFPPPTKAIAVKGSRSKRNGESCATNALQVCFDGIAKRMMMSTTCCEQLKEHHSCLCDVIKTRIRSIAMSLAFISSLVVLLTPNVKQL
ncbi:hypothetical protein DY000_02012354 [Brassica cretica]|uniref:Bifunctional inhibitor/plant lipid transfer protein/seed storage helical domain-containing protein n=1 Tax=Brassica cretica TaxID=69181 RepID=A0ABQ7CSR6_BRACR|nr:hypothetical protein DY000_02012354 [Brassica cretica]